MDMTASKFPSCSTEKEDLEGVFVKSFSACQQPFLSGIILSILSLIQSLRQAVLLRRDMSAPFRKAMKREREREREREKAEN
jgi:hypothetical protein